MIFTTLILQLVGMVNCSIPFIFLYKVFPQFLFRARFIILSSLVAGIGIGFINYASSKTLKNSWKFEPSEEALKPLQEMMKICGINPENVSVRYAYTDDNIALSMLDTVVIDPMIWQGISDTDDQYKKARTVIECIILPGVDSNKKKLHENIKGKMTLGAQRFIFKHELAHVCNNESYKRIASIAVRSSLVAGVACVLASGSIGYLAGYGAWSLAIVGGSVLDLGLGYLDNALIKTHQEKQADIFACTFSQKEEIEEAADFFEQYALLAQDFKKELGGLSEYLPQEIASGHPEGKKRADYLREIARNKN